MCNYDVSKSTFDARHLKFEMHSYDFLIIFIHRGQYERKSCDSMINELIAKQSASTQAKGRHFVSNLKIKHRLNRLRGRIISLATYAVFVDSIGGTVNCMNSYQFGRWNRCSRGCKRTCIRPQHQYTLHHSDREHSDIRRHLQNNIQTSETRRTTTTWKN